MGKGDVRIGILGDATSLKKAAAEGDAALDKMHGGVKSGFAESGKHADKFHGGVKSGFVESGKQADGFKSKLGGVSAGFAGMVAGIGFGAVIGGIKSTVEAASSLNETINKTKVVFGSSADAVIAMGETSAKALGMSKNEAIGAAATYGNLFRAIGLTTDVSADMSTKLVGLASDLASFNDADPKQVLDALRSGLVGETEPLRVFGVSLSAARVEAEALSMGLVKGQVDLRDTETATVNIAKANKAAAKAAKENGYSSLEYRDAVAKVRQAEDDLATKMKGKVPDLDAATKAQATYSLIMKDTALAQGDYANTADSYANKTRSQTAAFEDLKTQIGEKLLPVWMGGMAKMNEAADSLKKWWTENGPGLKETFHDVFGDDPAKSFAAGIGKIQTAGRELSDWWTSNIGTMQDFKRGLDGLEAGFRVIGDAASWVKNSVLDPLVGTVQDITRKFEDLSKNDLFKTIMAPLTAASAPITYALNAGKATGGILPDGLTPIGEMGPELAMTQGGQTRIIPNQNMGAALSGSTNAQPTSVNHTTILNIDGREIARSLERYDLAAA